jgi:hypothetical protein
MITFQNIGYMGRLGNQMFQFASTLGIGKKRGYDVKFPIENCGISHMVGPIDVKTGSIIPVKCDLLDCFDIPEKYFISSPRIQMYSLYNEGKFEYDESTEMIPDGTVLNGYFQTEKYFKGIREDLIKIFKFKKEFTELGDEYLDSIRENKKLLSLHIRRGDYTLYPDHHPVCDFGYYSRAIEEIRKNGGENFKTIIFSDDKDWCLSNMKDVIGENFIVSEIDNPYIELYMMSKCDYHIIANSSFSWWGSWLSDSKLTIAPSRWFGPAMGKNTNDVYCKNWIKI